MKVIFWSFCLSLFAAAKAFASPCAVCTGAIAGSLVIAKKLGLDECVIGVWAGAFLTMTGYWLIRWFEKKRWTFAGYKPFLMALSLASVGFLYIKELRYTPNVIGIFYMDSFLFTTLLGAVALIFGLHLYAWMKKKNGGHAHFPFEKVFVPVFLVCLTSLIIYYYPVCNCNRKSNVSEITDISFD